MNYKYFLLSAVLLGANAVSAQQQPTLTQYIYNRFSYNPAVAGVTKGASDLYLNHKRQWNNMPESPITTMGTFDMAVPNTNIGVGIQLYSDKAHLLANTGGSLNFAYHIPFNKDRTTSLSLGLSGGMDVQQFDFSRAVVSQQNDNALLASDATSASSVNAGAGANFHWKGLNAGISLRNLYTTNIRYRTETVGVSVRSAQVPQTMASLSYKFGKSDFITVEPTVMLRAVKNLPMQFDMGILASWKETIWVGAGYRTANVGSAGISGTIGMRLARRIMFAYSVENRFDTQDVYQSPFGLTHDITIGYRFGDTKTDSENDELRKIKEQLEKQDKMFSSKIDSISKVGGDRVAELETKISAQTATENANNGTIASLERKVGEAENEIVKLKNRPAQVITNSGGVSVPSTTSVITGSASSYAKSGSVYFENNSAVLGKKAKATLNSILEQMGDKNSSSPINLVGSASSEGNANLNLLLSNRRASAVKAYLEKRGVTRPIFISSEGAISPKSKDRKVEIFTGY